MMDSYLNALLLMLLMASLGWVYSVAKHNVNIVDSLWSLMFLASAIVYLLAQDTISGRDGLVMALVAAWSVRLSIFLAVRNSGEPEDRRYQEIRANNEPFAFKSLYIVFGLQAVLAWIISVPLLAALQGESPLGWLDMVAVCLWLVGFVFEAVGDWQLHVFKKNRFNQEQVLDTGLWNYTRHPNYFGEFCMWWAYFLLALSVGAWWTVYAPILMSLLLFKVSGVGLMEKDISSRRPAYKDYIERTNTFFPGPPKSSGAST